MICSKTINKKYFSLHSVLIFIHSETQHSKEQMKESISLSDSLPSVHVPVGYCSFASRQCACGREKKTSWGVSDGEQELRGLRLRDCTNHKKMGLSALEASLFSLRSIIFHRCCLDFKSLLPIYLLLPLLE